MNEEAGRFRPARVVSTPIRFDLNDSWRQPLQERERFNPDTVRFELLMAKLRRGRTGSGFNPDTVRFERRDPAPVRLLGPGGFNPDTVRFERRTTKQGRRA